ncbi:MAG: hypothetical protein LIV28_09725 [Lactobacillus sp.]|nr:hypothetical protein [Lactobacillus sp.]
MSETDKQAEVESCIESMKHDGFSVNLNNLLFGVVWDGHAGGWTYFDELSHRMYGKRQGEELTDSEIIDAINTFQIYTEADK